MVSERHRRGFVGLLIVVTVGGCRADLFRPDETVQPVVSDPYAAFQPWRPAFRVIGEDGQERGGYHVFVENGAYYSSHAPWSDRQESSTFRPDDPYAEPIHPPVDVEFDLGRAHFRHRLYGLTPSSGDTVVVDLRERAHRLSLGFAPPASWETGSVSLRTAVKRRFPSTDGREGPMTRWLYAGQVAGQGLAFGLDSTVTHVGRLSCGWGWSDGDSGGSVDWAWTPAEDVPVSDALDLRIEGSLVPFRVRLVRDGEPMRDTAVGVRTWPDLERSSLPDGVEFSTRHVSFSREGIHAVETLTHEVRIEVSPQGASDTFLPRRLDVDVVPDATIDVEIGRRDLGIEVVDPDGRPRAGSRVEIVEYSDGSLVSAHAITGPSGRVLFAVEDGLYDVEVNFDPRVEGAQVWTRVRVEGDTEVRVVLP